MSDWHDMTPQERDAERERAFAEIARRERESRELAWDNRRIIAGRWDWPDGALDECERVERMHPDWSPWWQPADERTGRPARYTARRHGHSTAPGVSGETGDELAAAIAATPDEPVIRPLKPLV